jgi:hypothetical protein
MTATVSTEKGYVVVTDPEAQDHRDAVPDAWGGRTYIDIAFPSDAARKVCIDAVTADPMTYRALLHRRPGVIAKGIEFAMDWNFWDLIRSLAWKGVEDEDVP